MGTYHQNAWFRHIDNVQASQYHYISLKAEPITIRELHDLLQAGIAVKEIIKCMAPANPCLQAIQVFARIAPQVYLPLLKTVLRRRPALADSADHLYDLALFAHHFEHAVRPLDTWQPHGKADEAVLQSLRRHLFVKYPVPACLERETKDNPFSWFIHWSNGISPRKFVQVPHGHVTPRILHLLYQAPTRLTFKKAFYWATAVSLGMNRYRATTLVEQLDSLNNYFKAAAGDFSIAPHPEAFLTSWFQFLVKYPEIESVDFGPIADYIFHKKYDFVIEGDLGIIAVKDENFSLKGKTPASLKAEVDRWHHHLMLERATSKLPLTWGKTGIPGFELVMGPHYREMEYHIVELNTQADLFKEGKTLRHCVSTYVGKCVSCYCSIWSLRCTTTQEHLVTIELSDRRIVQVRGKCNRMPNDREARIISEWVVRNGLKW